MKISLNWLGDYVEWKEQDPQVIAEKITAHIAEVDDVVEAGALLKHCCVGKVLSIEKHPNADKLVLCDVQTDQGKKRVVCGGTNLREGMRIAFAHVGATVRWHGEEMMTLETAKVRGEKSEGMICAAEELDLTTQFPEAVGTNIVDLGDGDDSVGDDLRTFLSLTDTVLDIDNHAITHRADLFSHVGFARECVAIGIAEWKKEPEFSMPEMGKDPLPFNIKNDANTLIPRYLACTLSFDTVGETPSWMRARLEATGWRSLNLPVDITNYVSMELGMPLHSFDLADLRGDIHMRTAKQGEKITTLDDIERDLPAGALVLSDDEGIFDLLGIMGGLRSSTKETTTNVLLHSAVVDPHNIRRTIMATGHRTDAATVYEKGIPPVSAEQGFARALALFLELVPGAKVTSTLESWGNNGTAPQIDLPVARVQSVLGKDIPAKEMVTILEDLGCTVQQSKEVLVVTPPLWRLSDIQSPIDIIEEVGRVHGYSAITSVMPSADTTPPARDHRLNTMRQALKECGFFELVPFSLIGPELLKRTNMDPSAAVRIQNPLGEEMSLLCPHTLPALLSHAKENTRTVQQHLLTYTVSHVFQQNSEFSALGALLCPLHTLQESFHPFVELKQVLMHAASVAGHTLDVQSTQECMTYAHPGRTAVITSQNERIGHLFELHPAVCANFDLPARTCALQLNLDQLFALEPATTVPKMQSAFPAITYDETVQMTHDQSVDTLLASLQDKSSLLESVDIADVYEKDTKSYNLTLRFTYRSSERTLKEEEVKAEHEKIMDIVS
jgi:phenylalanyl-tRNA synthetase beta chain